MAVRLFILGLLVLGSCQSSPDSKGEKIPDRQAIATGQQAEKNIQFLINNDSVAKQIAQNAGVDGVLVAGRLLEKGDTNIGYLKENGVRIWDEWANENGDLGPVYGHQWRNWNSEEIDQISELIKELKSNPNSRRMLVSAWNPSVLPDTSKSFDENVANNKAALPPCHAFFQFYVSDGKLSCQLYQRSADIFLGVPFNIASYALLTMMIAQVCNLAPGEFIHTFGDAHIYNNHFEQLELQLSREPKPLPKMILNPEIKDIFDFDFEDFTLEGYEPHALIKGNVAV